jgi:hypothetical protein
MFEQRQDPDAAPSNANQESRQVKNRVRICANKGRNSPRQWGASAFLHWKSAHQDDEVLLRDGCPTVEIYLRTSLTSRSAAEISTAVSCHYEPYEISPLVTRAPSFIRPLLLMDDTWALSFIDPFSSWTNLVLLHSSAYFSWMKRVYLHSSTFSWMCTWASSFIDLLIMDDNFGLLHTSTVFSWMCTWVSSFIDLPFIDDSFVPLYLSTFFSWIVTSCFFVHPPSSHG